MPRPRSILWILPTLLLSIGGGAHAAGSEKMSCIDENVEAQELQRAGKFRDAEKKLVACADESCPGAVRGDCATLLKQVEDSMPTVSVSAKSTDGNDLATVSVSVDAEPFVDRPAGRSFEIDPGSHVVHVAFGTQHRDQNAVFVAGQKDRALTFDFTDKTARSAIDNKMSDAPAPQSSSFKVPVVAWILGGVAVASAGAFVYFGLTGNSIKSRLDSTCGPTRSCSDSEFSDLKTTYTAADIFAGVAVVSLAGAVVTTIVWPRASTSVDVAITGRGAVLSGRF